MYKWSKTKDLDAKKVAKNAMTYTVLLLALGAMTFFGVCDPSGQQSVLPGGKAAVVGDHALTSTDFRRAYRNAYEQYQNRFKDQFDPSKMNLSGQVMNSLVDELVIYAESVRSGIVVSESEITSVILDADVFKKDGKFDPDRFKVYLRNLGHTEKSFEEELRRRISNDKFRQLVTDSYVVSKSSSRWAYRMDETKYELTYLKVDKSAVKIDLPQKEIDEFLAKEDNKKLVEEDYNKNKSSFNTPKKVRAQHILVTFKGARDAAGDGAKRSKEEALSLAKDILSKVRAKKAEGFADFAKEFSDDPSGKKNGGDLGLFAFEDMVPAFSKVAFEMKKGEVSEPVESPFGFHIIKVNQVVDQKVTPEAEAKRRIAEKLLKKTKAPLVLIEESNNLLAKLKKNESVDDELKRLGIKWESTGEFSASAGYIKGLGVNKDAKAAALSLEKPGELYQSVLDINGDKFVVRLKSLNKPDMSKLDDKKIAEMQEKNKFYDAYTMYIGLRKEIREHYEKRGAIWENSEFKMLSATQGAAGT